MGLMRNILLSIAGSLVLFSTAFFVSIIPCQIAPNVPNPAYFWEMCDLGSENFLSFGVQKLYYGLIAGMTETYMATFFGIFAIIFVVISLISRKLKRKKGE
jgi:hypothetical protein